MRFATNQKSKKFSLDGGRKLVSNGVTTAVQMRAIEVIASQRTSHLFRSGCITNRCPFERYLICLRVLSTSILIVPALKLPCRE